MSTDHESVPSSDETAEAMREALTRISERDPATPIEWNTVLSRARRVAVVRRALAAACVFVVLSAAAVGFAAATRGHRRGVRVVETPTTATAPSVCVHSPIAHVVNSYYGLPALHGTSIDYLALHAAGRDTEGDTIRPVGLSVEKTGPRGTVTLTSGDPGAEVVLRGWGDFDGDGRSDVLVDLYRNGADSATYIVSGTVPPGVHDPATVGIRVPRPHLGSQDVLPFPEPVGDQDHDGADDVSFGAALYSGRQLTTAPAPTVLPRPIRTLTSPYVGLLQLDASGPPSFVEADLQTSFVAGRPDTSALDVLDRPGDRLILGGSSTPDLAKALDDNAHAIGTLVHGHHIVEFDDSTRSGDTAWRWDLDGPCSK